MYLELFEYCRINVKFGPKVMMIGKMVLEMLGFFPFFFIFLLGFGVGEQSTLYPFRTGYSGEVLEAAFTLPIYRIFGENNLDEVVGMCVFEAVGYNPTVYSIAN